MQIGDHNHKGGNELSRRSFLLASAGAVLGGTAGGNVWAQPRSLDDAPGGPHHPPRAKRIIYLHMAGSPPQQDLFDYKPELNRYDGTLCPKEFFEGKRLAFIKGHPELQGHPHGFYRAGERGQWVTNLMPNFGRVADKVTLIRSMHTDQFNHAPAQQMIYTGSPRAGAASLGSWIQYALGSANQDLPGYVVMVSGGSDPSGGNSLWGPGFLPSRHQGTRIRSGDEPVLYLKNPEGLSRTTRRQSLDLLRRLNEREFARVGDPETRTRTEQFELAYRMQDRVPDLVDLSTESAATRDAYGVEASHDTTFARNCLLARRLLEQGVRFIHLFDWGWDIHGTSTTDDLITQFPRKCQHVDRPIAALLMDLEARGLLDDTLVIFSGEFGRTPMREARDGSKLLGRDHHERCFTIWMAGGGVKRGMTYGKTCPLGFDIVENPVGIRDFQATVLYLMGLDPNRLTFPYQGLDQRLIGPAAGPRVMHDLLA